MLGIGCKVVMHRDVRLTIAASDTFPKQRTMSVKLKNIVLLTYSTRRTFKNSCDNKNLS